MEILNKVGGAIGIVTLFLAAAVYLYSTARKGRADIVRQDNTDLRQSNQEIRTERATLEERVKNQDDQIRTLKELAVQTPAVTKLIEMNSVQQKQASEHHTQVIEEMGKMTVQIGALAGAISNSYKGQKT
jgi:septal ring factor EnvC (AmiA/AmiB activator)